MSIDANYLKVSSNKHKFLPLFKITQRQTLHNTSKEEKKRRKKSYTQKTQTRGKDCQSLQNYFGTVMTQQNERKFAEWRKEKSREDQERTNERIYT